MLSTTVSSPSPKKDLNGLKVLTIFPVAAVHVSADPFEIAVEDLVKDIDINVVSAFAALKYAINAFKELPKGVEKTFIYTGNGLTDKNIARMMTAGLGKRAGLFLIENAVETHRDEGIRFVEPPVFRERKGCLLMFIVCV